MSEYIATAKVRVRADLTGFREELRESIISSSNNVRVKVPVVPDMKGFRASLLAKIKEVERNIVIKVPIQAGEIKKAAAQGAASATGGGGAAASKAASAQEQQQAGVRDKLALSTLALTEAERANITTEQQGILVSRADAEAKAALAGSLDLVSTSANNTNRSLKRQSLDQVSSVAATKERIALDQAAQKAAAKSAAIQAAASESLLSSQVKLLEAEIAEQAITDATVAGKRTTAELKELNAQLTIQEAAATEAIAAAQTLENHELRELIELKAAEITVRQGAIASELADAKASQKAAAQSASNFRGAAKGAGAATATLFGVRGATLAASSAFLGGTVAVAAFAKALQNAAKLETTLNVFAETAQATEQQMAEASITAQKLGADITLPAVSASDAAEAFTELAKAGLDVEDSIDGARGVLQLATAAQISNAEATELAASALNSFGLAGDQATRVADLLTGASNEAQGSITDAGIALQQSAAAARQVGFSLEDTVSILTLLARNGLRGSDAGTSLRTALLRLIRPTEKAADLFKKFNIQLRDQQGNLRPEVFNELGVAFDKLSRKQRDANFAIIGGQDAFRTLAILAREGKIGLQEVEDAITRQGLAADLAGARTQGLAGDVEALKNNVETLSISIGKGATPFIKFFIDPLNAGLGAANDAVAFLQERFGKGFDVDNADLAQLIDRLSDLQDFKDLRVELGGEEAKTNLEGVDVELQSIVDALSKTTGGADKMIAAFSQGSPQIAAAMKDGIITPLEAAQLQTIELGKIFLSGLPKDVFVGLGGTVRSNIEDATASAKVAVADLGAEIRSGIEDASRAAVVAARGMGEDIGDAFLEGLLARQGRIAGQVAGLGQQVIQAQIGGDQQAELDALRETFRLQQETVDILKQRIKEGGPGSAAALKQLRQQALPDLLATQNAIDQILTDREQAEEKKKRDAEQHKRDLEQAAKAAHQAILDGFSLEISRQQNAIAVAAATESLRDDLRENKQLIGILRKIIASGKLTNDELEDFRGQILDVQATRKDILEQIAEVRKERAATLVQSAELDVDLAVQNENVAGEIRARQKLIKQLKKAQNLEKEGTVEWKRLRNQINEQKKAIQEAKKAEADKGNAASKFIFEFLQTQQGFAANLFGNLIPLANTGGLVGNAPRPGQANAPQPVGGGSGGPGPVRAQQQGPSATGGGGGVPIDQGLAQDAELAKSEERAGPTKGQQTAVISILRHILTAIERQNVGAGHVEAKNQRKRQSGAMDTM